MTKLIIYPHGLGDIILLTPALSALRDQEIHVAVLKRFAGTEILDACPYAKVHYVLPDPWNDCGTVECRAAGVTFAKTLKAEPVWIWHRTGKHKITENCISLNVVGDLHTHVYISDYHRDLGADWLRYRGLIDSSFVFIHADTGMPGKTNAGGKKDFSANHAINRSLQRWPELRHAVVVGESFGKESMPVPAQFVIMGYAARRILADSVFYHAAHAMRLPVDFAYFGRGKKVYDRVKPLHEVQETVSWTPMA